ncbi:MAG: YeeE/YedE family protein [Burkholderiales bacterium]|nr:YeeE/YedE family protein [Burkholderiales bacterium]NBO76372.1 YeeE/YedE family protein [Betaproteobacteria bacterium]
MQEVDVVALGHQVLWATFALSLAFGLIAQKTHFCTMGAVGDILNIGDWGRMRMWALAIGVAMLGFNGMVALGWLDPAKTFYTQPRVPVLSLALGGLMFGVGMVLASGCGSKTLVRIGGGNLKSLVVFAVMAIAALAAMRGVFGVARVQWLDPVAITLPGGQHLSAVLAGAAGLTPAQGGLWAGLVLGGGLVAWSLLKPEGRSADVLLGGLGIGAVTAGLWWVSGVLGFVPEHPETLEAVYLATNSKGMESFTFVGPVGYAVDWLTYFSDKSKVLTLGIVTVPGVILGAWWAAWRSGSFRWESFRGTEDLVNHLLGAVLMGVGGVTAMGCTIGQGLSGVSTLALGSFIALVFIIIGSVIGLRWQMWRIERAL